MIRHALWLLVVYLMMQAWKWFRARTSHQLIMQHAARQIANRWACNLNKLGLEERLPNEMRVLQMTALQLRQSMQSGEFTTAQLVSMYIRRCAHFGRLLNASTAELFAQALKAAKECDERRKAGNPPRLLEGIPISIKDCFAQTGYDNTCGLASKVGVPESQDCLCVKLLVEAGAIPFVRTNVPPVLMAWETANNVFGETRNPWNTERIAGGSSGGEAALIAAGASPLGVGTDIGGSVRLPAHCCGVYSLKPTTRRISTNGMGCQEVPGQITVLSSPGPMGRSVDDLVLVMKAWLASSATQSGGASTAHDLDPYSPPTPFQEELFLQKTSLRVGVYPDNGCFESSLPCSRALREVTDYLKTLPDVTVVEFKFAELAKASELMSKILVADNGEWLSEVLQGETAHPTVADGIVLGRIPTRLASWLGWGLQQTQKTRRLGKSLQSTFGRPIRSAAEMFEFNAEVEKFRRDFLAAFAGLDVLICPTIGVPAPRHGQSKKLLDTLYTGIYNLLEWPAGHVPISLVKASECYYMGQPADIISEVADAEMKGAEGLPVGIQVAAPPYHDEVVLRVMKLLEAKFPFVLAPMGQVSEAEAEKAKPPSIVISSPSSSSSAFSSTNSVPTTPKSTRSEKEQQQPQQQQQQRKQSSQSISGGEKKESSSRRDTPRVKKNSSTSNTKRHVNISQSLSPRGTTGSPLTMRPMLSTSCSFSTIPKMTIEEAQQLPKSESGMSLPAELPIVECPRSRLYTQNLGGMDIREPICDLLSPLDKRKGSTENTTLFEETSPATSVRSFRHSPASEREIRLREEDERRMQEHEQQMAEEEEGKRPPSKRVVSDPDEFVQLLASGDSTDIRVDGLYGRLAKGKVLADFSRLSTEEWKRLSWVMGPDQLLALLKIVRKGPPVGRNIADYLGLLPEAINSYLERDRKSVV